MSPYNHKGGSVTQVIHLEPLLVCEKTGDVTVLIAKCGYSYRIHVQSNSEYGILSKDRNWTGMIGEVKRGVRTAEKLHIARIYLNII